MMSASGRSVNAQINGIACTPRHEVRAGKKVWVLNPYGNANALLDTTLPPVRDCR